jgi:hypothetical protein
MIRGHRINPVHASVGSRQSTEGLVRDRFQIILQEQLPLQEMESRRATSEPGMGRTGGGIDGPSPRV